jgi:hypothetical protein
LVKAEELLRSGEIRFKSAGKRKVMEKADADAWADAQPYAEIKSDVTPPTWLYAND